MLDFELNKELPISKSFRNLGVNSFSEAKQFVKNLPYGRNANRQDFSLVLKEQKGTCSSKHALLKSLADENKHSEVQLMLGIFKMNGINTPKVKNTLEKYGLEYIPEAHNYLKMDGEFFDCTSRNSLEINFLNDLLKEKEIRAEDVSSLKIDYHKKFLKKWIQDKSFSLEEIWLIREECINSLSSNSK